MVVSPAANVIHRDVRPNVCLDGWIGGTWRVEYPLADGPLVSWRDQYLNMTDEALPMRAGSGQASKLIQQTAFREFLRTKHGARSPLRQSGQQSPSSRAGPAKPRCSAANHNGVRGDLRIMDRGIPSHQIGSHQDTGCVPGRVFLADLSAVHRRALASE